STWTAARNSALSRRNRPAVPTRASASQRTEWKRFRASTTPRLAPRTTAAIPPRPSASALTPTFRTSPAGPPPAGSLGRVPPRFPLGTPPRRRGLHGPEPGPGRPGRLELPAQRVEAVLVEEEVPAVGRGQIEGPEHDDRVGRTDLDAELAELARVELEGEELRVVPLLRFQHLNLDHLGRADELAEAAADAVLLAGLRVVGERQDPAGTVGGGAGHPRGG